MWLISIGFVWRFLTTVCPDRVLYQSIPEDLAVLRIVKLAPALLIWLFRKARIIRGSGGLVSPCKSTHTPRAAFRPRRRAGRFS